MATKDKNPNAKTELLPGEVIIEIPLKDIHSDNAWNVRSNLNDGSLDDSDNSLDDLQRSIELNGQDSPIIVRTNPDKRGAKYKNVAGHRRFEVIRRIAEKAEEKNPVIKAVFRDLNELEARKLNVRENTARANLSAADTAFGVEQLMAQMPPGTTQTAIAEALGIKQGYVSRLARINKEVVPEVRKAWRANVVVNPETGNESRPVKPLDVEKMVTFCKTPTGEQGAEFFKIASTKVAGSTGRKAQIELFVKSCAKWGAIFGRLGQAGCITLPEGFWGRALPLLEKGPKEATDADRAQAMKAASAAYHEALVAEPPKPKEPKAAKAAKNGAAVAAS